VPGRELRRLDVGGTLAGGKERVGEHPPVGDVRDHRAQPFAQGTGRGGRLREFGRGGAELGYPLVVDGLEQLRPGREVPVEGGVPDPGRLGDVVQRGAGALGVERGLGRRQQAFAVALRVGPLGNPGCHAADSTCKRGLFPGIVLSVTRE
jgi:hypothetical protein